MRMQCENMFCIYWKEGKCLLDKISLDIMGCCQECIYVDIGEESLRMAREKAIEKYENTEML